MGTANGILVTCCELSDTLDVTPRYADVVYLLQDGSEGADAVAEAWLNAMAESVCEYSVAA